jgi:hypothetical protein
MITSTMTPTADQAEATRAGVTVIELSETMRALVVYGPGDWRRGRKASDGRLTCASLSQESSV